MVLHTPRHKGGLSVEVDPATGDVTITGTPADITIDPEKFKDPNFEFEMTSGVPVTVGDYVYETEADDVILSGIESGSGNPKVTLPLATDVMNVLLAKDSSKTTAYTAAGENTQFVMSNAGTAANTAKADLIGKTENSGLTFTGTAPVTINGITYQGENDESTYNVMFGADGKNEVVLPNNETKVTATFTEPQKSLITDANQVGGKNINEEGLAESMPFTSATIPSSIVISKDANGDVNVTNGSQSSLSPVKDELDKIIGYEVKNTSSGSSGSSSSSGAHVTKPQNGTITVDKSNASSGQTVTITTKPDDGYKLGSLTIVDSKGNPVEVKDLGNGEYSFVQPENVPVTIKAIFVEGIACDRDKNCPAYGFTDLDLNKWYHDGIHFCVENDLMEGVPGNLFAPNADTTRGMIVTILYRLEGKPAVSDNCSFSDVKTGSWYEDAVIWAAANDIIEGYGNGKFGPNDAITREQIAAILYRYAEYKGYDVTDKANLSKFEDKNGISAWAQTALSWANADGLIEGDGDKLMPKENARRCQVAAILMRFCQNIVK